SGVACKSGSTHRLDGLGSEPSGCEFAGRPRPRPQPSDHHPGPLGLGVQSPKRPLAELTLDSLALEVGVDGNVSVTARGKRSGTIEGEVLIVDDPRALERRDRLVSHVRCDA